MIKGLWKMSVNFRIAAVLIMMVLLSGCRAEKSKEIPQGVSVIHEQYINRSYEKVLSVLTTTQSSLLFGQSRISWLQVSKVSAM